MTAPRRRLAALLEQVAGEGTDHEALLAVLAWVVRPKRSGDALRRRCLEDGAQDAPPAIRLAAAAGEGTLEGIDATTCEVVSTLLASWEAADVRAALVGDPGYPTRLASGWPDREAPSVLGWRGSPPCDDRPAVALVGARRATGYGSGVTAWLAETVARAGVHVVSGGAVGVDAAAHGAALGEAGGTTVVLGCGHGVAYPRPHAEPGGLFDRVIAGGGRVLSELLPWQAPKPGTVRARNRIVAGLSDVVVVVEGGERSGALVTATAAAERGIPVLAVPGDVRAPGSAAPHRLLTEGAAPCTGPADLLDALALHHVGLGAPLTEEGTAPRRDRTAGGLGVGALPAPVEEVLVAAWPRPIRVDDLAARTGYAPAVLLAAITRARVAGSVAEGVDGVRLRRAPRQADAGS
jgi:DNA processing protein